MATSLRSTWGIVLAGGEGKRLQQFIRAEYGTDCPKQYCAFTGTRSMLRHTIDRANMLLPSERLLTVVTRKHLAFAIPQLSDQQSSNVIVQPENRETAPGILYPLLHVYQRDPQALVCLFPSDHFIIEEERFMEHVRFALESVRKEPDAIVLLGIEPNEAEGEYGWIVPDSGKASANGMLISRVSGFVEKPDTATAERLLHRGGLWNTLVVVARAGRLMEAFRSLTPSLFDSLSKLTPSFGTHMESRAAVSAYETLAAVNFSHAILSKLPHSLRTVRVDGVYWSDWGNAGRIRSDLARFTAPPAVYESRLQQSHSYSFAG